MKRLATSSQSSLALLREGLSSSSWKKSTKNRKKLMDKPQKDDNILYVNHLKLKQIADSLGLKPSTAKYAAKHSDALSDMPPEGVPGRPRLFRLDQAVRFSAAVMLVRGGVTLDLAGPLLDYVEKVVDEANKIEALNEPEYRYSVGRKIDSDPWLLTIRDDEVAEIWRGRLAQLIKNGHGHLENMTHAVDVVTLNLAGDREYESDLMQVVINLSEIEDRLIAQLNQKSKRLHP